MPFYDSYTGSRYTLPSVLILTVDPSWVLGFLHVVLRAYHVSVTPGVFRSRITPNIWVGKPQGQSAMPLLVNSLKKLKYSDAIMSWGIEELNQRAIFVLYENILLHRTMERKRQRGIF